MTGLEEIRQRNDTPSDWEHRVIVAIYEKDLRQFRHYEEYSDGSLRPFRVSSRRLTRTTPIYETQ